MVLLAVVVAWAARRLVATSSPVAAVRCAAVEVRPKNPKVRRCCRILSSTFFVHSLMSSFNSMSSRLTALAVYCTRPFFSACIKVISFRGKVWAYAFVLGVLSPCIASGFISAWFPLSFDVFDEALLSGYIPFLVCARISSHLTFRVDYLMVEARALGTVMACGVMGTGARRTAMACSRARWAEDGKSNGKTV